LGEFVGDYGEISDPFGQGIEVYEQVAKELKQKLSKILERLEKN